mgnify:CR=1 FL=1
MTDPTDAEIDALWRFEAIKNWDSTLAMRTSFARAVLAKWGTPAFVGVEPYAQHAIWHVRDGDMGWDQYHDSSDPMPLGWDGDAPDEVIDLYTAAQAQAGAVPLTDAQIDQAIAELGLNYLADAHATNRAVLQKLCRHAHSIKGGQHDV